MTNARVVPAVDAGGILCSPLLHACPEPVGIPHTPDDVHHTPQLPGGGMYAHT